MNNLKALLQSKKLGLQLQEDSLVRSFPSITALQPTYTAQCNTLTPVLQELSNVFLENAAESVIGAGCSKKSGWGNVDVPKNRFLFNCKVNPGMIF